MSEIFTPVTGQNHVLVLLPNEEEFGWVSNLLDEASIPYERCSNTRILAEKAQHGFTAILIAAEAVDPEATELIKTRLQAQEPWSELPVLCVTDPPDLESLPASLQPLSNKLTILQRPMQAVTLTNTLKVALRTRLFQYQVNELLAQRHSVLASINDSFLMVDRNWKFVYVNQKAVDMYALAGKEVIGSLIWEAIPELAQEPVRRELQQAAEEQREFHTEYHHASSQRWYEQRIYPSGAGVSIFTSDITERKQAEESLRYQLGITQAITDNAADSLFLLDPAGQVTFMNPAAEKTFGWKKEELLGKVLHDHVHYHKSRGAKMECPLHSVFTSGLTLRDLEDQFHCKDGSRLNVSCSNAAIIIDGEPTGSVLVVHDITYHKLAEQQLKALNENLELRVAERTAIAEQRATQLSALASELTQTEQRERRRLAHSLHDNLQQILVATKLQVSMMRSRVDDDSLREEMLQIEDLINRSVEESRTLTVELSPPILYDAGLARALEWLARRMLQEHGLTVHLQADPAAEAEGDDIRAFLFQAVREALFNIVKHAGVKEASVSIELAERDKVVVQVKDEGIGFESQPTEKKDISAGGFGLFSIRERLEFLGGRMAIKSAPGCGTCVSLYVPIREETKNSAREAGANKLQESGADNRTNNQPDGSGNIIRVLLADDHKMLRDGLAGLLREQPDIRIVSEASDGRMAIKLAHETDPHVVIMDVTMPLMNGVEATRRLARELPHIKVIGLSMHEKEDMAKAMREAGAVNYITKGAPSEILTAAIRDCMKETPPHDGQSSRLTYEVIEKTGKPGLLT